MGDDRPHVPVGSPAKEVTLVPGSVKLVKFFFRLGLLTPFLLMLFLNLSRRGHFSQKGSPRITRQKIAEFHAPPPPPPRGGGDMVC